MQAPLVSDLAEPRLLGRYMALSALSWQLGFALGPAIGGFLLAVSAHSAPGSSGRRCARVGAGLAIALERTIPIGDAPYAGRPARVTSASSDRRRRLPDAGSAGTMTNMVLAIDDPLSTHAEPPPDHTQERRSRSGADDVARAPHGRPSSRASGLTWVNVVVARRRDGDRCSPSASAGIRSTSRTSSPSASGRRSTTTRRSGTSSPSSTSPCSTRPIQRLNAAELDVFIGHDYLVTLPNRELLPVTRLFTRCESDEDFREQLFAKGAGRLLYEVLDDLFDYCFPILDKIGHKLDRIEDEMFEGAAEDVVRDISNVKQEII